jgi:predicted component of viral defense system (DUF524 family)
MGNLYKKLEKKYMFTNDVLCLKIMWAERFKKALSEDDTTPEEQERYFNLLNNKLKELEEKLNNIYN